MKRLLILVALTMLVAFTAQAAPVTITAVGTVGWNGIQDEPLSDVSAGEMVFMTIQVDSDVYTDGVPDDVRGYDIQFFDVSFASGLGLGLLAGAPDTYFALIDGYPASDGFFVSSSTSSPGGVPLVQEPFNFNLDLGYVGETLDNLNILDALGTYNYDGLTRFGFNLWSVFPDNVAMDIEFQQLIITSPLPTEESSWSGVKAMYR